MEAIPSGSGPTGANPATAGRAGSVTSKTTTEAACSSATAAYRLRASSNATTPSGSGPRRPDRLSSCLPRAATVRSMASAVSAGSDPVAASHTLSVRPPI